MLFGSRKRNRFWQIPSQKRFRLLFPLQGALSASLLVLPFVDSYKSPRAFAFAVGRIVPPAHPLFIYADTMNDFNFYTGREVIPVLSSPAELESIVARAGTAYLVVRERDVQRLGSGAAGEILAEGRVGDKKWRLLLLRR